MTALGRDRVDENAADQGRLRDPQAQDLALDPGALLRAAREGHDARCRVELARREALEAAVALRDLTIEEVELRRRGPASIVKRAAELYPGFVEIVSIEAFTEAEWMGALTTRACRSSEGR